MLITSPFKPSELQEIHCLFRTNSENDIMNMSSEQRNNYRDHIFGNIQQLVASQATENQQIRSQIFCEIQRSIEILAKLADCGTLIPSQIFFYIINFASKQNLLDTIFLFVVSTFKINPEIINQLFEQRSNFQKDIYSFIDRFSYPFNDIHFNFAVTLINTSQQICDVLIIYNIVDKIQYGILASIETGRNFSQYWFFALTILEEITKNCTKNIVLFCSICEMCFIFLNDRYPKKLVLQSVECMITISTRSDDLSILNEISHYLSFFDHILCGNNNINEIQPVMKLIATISTKCKEIDLYKNNFIQHLIDLSTNWNQKGFEPIYNYLFQILTFILQFHPKLIINITKSCILSIAAFYINNGGCSIKNNVSLFISRLCDNFFWGYVSDFFDENFEIISSLFLMLQAETDQKSKIIIIHGLTSLAHNLKLANKCCPNIISQFSLQSSVDAFNEIQNSEDTNIQGYCKLLNQEVNDLIQEYQ